MADAITSYLNTLIFCIVAKSVTLILLILLLFDIGWAFSYLILTLEIGLVAIIAWTLYSVYKVQKAIDEAAAAASKQPPMLNTCPDYFVRGIDSETNDQICSNTYKTSDGKTTYKFTSDGTTAIPTKDMTTMTNGQKTMNSLCTAQQSDVSGFSWSDLKARCGWMDTYV